MDDAGESFPPDWLDDENNIGLGRQPIPRARDDKITELLRTWTELSTEKRAEAAHNISRKQHWTLLSYAERMASLAVRENNEWLVILGLIALALAYRHGDYRDGILRLAPLYDAATRVTGEPDKVFIKAAEFLDRALAEQVIGLWLRRAPESRSLNVMGYRASTDPEGFRYDWQP